MVMRQVNFFRKEGVVMASGEKMKLIELVSRIEFPEILEADGIKHNDMKEMTIKEYLRRMRKILGSRLNSRKIISQ